jgi:hypothetical protein
MCLLKKKIAKAKANKLFRQVAKASGSFKINSKKITKGKAKKTNNNVSQYGHTETVSKIPRQKELSLKNVAKNYGRAICKFALCSVGENYLQQHAAELDVNIADFKNYLKEKKETLDGVENFRELLLIRGIESQKLKKHKLLFQRLCEIFIKYFSVNWIFGGKLNYKQEYLRLRFKMLRRIQNPEIFTVIR